MSNSLKNYQLSKYVNRLTVLSISILSIPIFYLLFTPYTYGYGLNFYGIFLYFSPLFLLLVVTTKVRKSYKREGSNRHITPQQKFPSWLVILACFGLAAYVYGVVIQRIGSVNIFDIRSLYLHFGSDGDAERLSIVGLLGVFFVPISFVLFAVSENFSGLKKILLIIPIISFVILNLLMAKRQISLFFIFFILSMLIFRVPRISAKVLMKGLLAISLFLVISTYVGFQRSGFDSIDTQLEQNQHDQSVSLAPILGLTWGYIGSGPEFLSILTDNVDPLYMPFSTTNSFILRRINSVTDYIDYERDIVPATTGVVENITGLGARSWAGGVLQLYIEGGFVLIIGWYLSLFLWFRYILYRSENGFSMLLDTSFFGAIVVMNLFVFPFKDQNVFLAFCWYVLMVAARHVRYGRLKIRLGM